MCLVVYIGNLLLWFFYFACHFNEDRLQIHIFTYSSVFPIVVFILLLTRIAMPPPFLCLWGLQIKGNFGF